MNRKEVQHYIPVMHKNESGMPPAAAVCSEYICRTQKKPCRDIIRRYKLTEEEAQYAIRVLKEEVSLLNRLLEGTDVGYCDNEHYMDGPTIMNCIDTSTAILSASE